MEPDPVAEVAKWLEEKEPEGHPLVAKLSLQDGDILLIRAKKADLSSEAIARYTAGLRRLFCGKNVEVVFVLDDLEFTVVRRGE